MEVWVIEWESSGEHMKKITPHSLQISTSGLSVALVSAAAPARYSEDRYVVLSG